MTELEKILTLACWRAWRELNEIRARDGVPRGSSVTADYFSSVVDDCQRAIETATGKPVTPWEPEV